MPEMKNNFQRGRMNKDLDERLVPDGEYRDALNVEIATSNSSDMGTLQTLKGNTKLDGQMWGDGVCIGSIADDKNDKLYFMVAGVNIDRIIEYDYTTEVFAVVCVDNHANPPPGFQGKRALDFNENFLITGINVIDDMLFWTDNNSEPKRISIRRGIEGTDQNGNIHTSLMIRDVGHWDSVSGVFIQAPADEFINSGNPIQEEHLTVIKKGPPAAPVLEMIDTLHPDKDFDGEVGGDEMSRAVANASTLDWLDSEGEFNSSITIIVAPDPDGDFGSAAGVDFPSGAFLNVYKRTDRTVKVRIKINAGAGSTINFDCSILSGNKEIQGEEDLVVEIEQIDPLFQFKFPRFAYRYKYEDGEYSCFSPFTEVAFLPGKFNYLPKEGYNLGMVNNLRRLAIKDFVHKRKMSDEVIAIDILYKESNSPNIYSVKTIKRRGFDPGKWDEWNATSRDTTTDVTSPGFTGFEGTKGNVTGYMPITTEMIHAVLPANQLLRPWDNVPRKALAQEVIGNRLVYGNYLQNYNLSNPLNSNIKVDIHVSPSSRDVGTITPEEIDASRMTHLQYLPAKSLKSLRTYQVGVVYIDKYGRETPVFSEDKRGSTSNLSITEASVYIEKNIADKRNLLKVKLNNDPPSFATHFKFFIKETSNEYYNLAMDRWYDAEDGNIWLSFPSAERNKVDEQTFLILKKEHDNNMFVADPARYKIIAIENEAPRFIKLKDISMGAVTDGLTNSPASPNQLQYIAPYANYFPLVDGWKIAIHKEAFEGAGWKESLINQDISQCFFRVKGSTEVSLWYRLKQITYDSAESAYILAADKQFTGDMGHTSTNNNYASRYTNLEIQIMKKIPEDRAEFEGRFFVKILKDHTLIEKLGILGVATDNMVTIKTMRVQYIAPKETQCIGTSGTGWNGYGTDPMQISLDKDGNGSHNKVPSGFTSIKNGHGKDFWEKAGDDSHNSDPDSTASGSSGWFIDKVEAFRPVKGATSLTISGKDNNVKWSALQDNENTWDGLYSDYYDDPSGELLQVVGCDTYNQSGTTYLGLKAKRPSPALKSLTAAQGGDLGRSLGIDTSIDLIHLSYAGLNSTERTASNGKYDGAVNGWENADWAWNNANKHAEDTAFIEKLMQPNTIWRWKEDPGIGGKPILYKTIPFSVGNSEFDSGNYQRERSDRDGEPGAFFYNYAVLRDYTMYPHHKITGHCTLSGHWNASKVDWASRNMGNHTGGFDGDWPWYVPGCWVDYLWWESRISLSYHASPEASGPWGQWPGLMNAHHKFPNGIHNWEKSYNRRRRFSFFAEAVEINDNTGLPFKLGAQGPHNYLPTNNPQNDPHFDYLGVAITEYPVGHASAGTTIPTPAPGIRPDGMFTGYSGSEVIPYNFDEGDGAGAVPLSMIPEKKRWDAGSNPRIGATPGSVTWEIVEQFDESSEKFTSTNPAIWETEPKEDVGLDIYHEVGQIYPIELNSETIEQFVGAVHFDLSKNSFVQCWKPPYDLDNNPVGTSSMILLEAYNDFDIRVNAVKDNYVRLGTSLGTVGTPVSATMYNPGYGVSGHVTPPPGSYLIFHRADGSTTEAHVGYNTYTDGGGTWYELVGMNGDVGVHNKQISLPWFNCYSFGNGVESDRIRDDYNQVTIDNGPKASTTLEEPYLEERRKNGFIWSGLYNSTSGVNDTNQFIQAEAITKDVNPTYGSIQKLHARDSDLVAFCEDRVLRVHANKDALYNADGNTNVVATNRVLGSIKPFVGDYGISLNPESFASDSYRLYFSDTSRGAILRLSQDGITNISDLGMSDWFSDELALTKNHKIIGSFDDNKSEYNITLKSIPATTTTITEPGPCDTPLGTGLGSGSGSSSGTSTGTGTGTGEPGGQTGTRYYCNGTYCQPCNPFCQNNNPTWVTYATLTGCQNNCSPPPEAWKCVDGNCVYDTNGNYTSQADCIQSGCGHGHGG